MDQQAAAAGDTRPPAMDNVDRDELALFTAEAQNLPKRLVRERDQVLKIRAQRAEEQEAAENAQLAGGTVDAGAKLLKALPQEAA